MNRNRSSLEVLRVILLFLLISTHWAFLIGPSSYIDTKIIWDISFISVTCFGLITGMFVFRERSLVYRNVSRLIFIIIISSLIMCPMLLVPGFKLDSETSFKVFTGSAHIWYIYAIIPMYILGPLINKWAHKTSTLKLMLIGLFFFTIGIAGVYMDTLNGILYFYLTKVGIFFSISFLLGLGFFGFILKRVCDKEWKHKKNIFLLIALSGALLLELFYFFVGYGPSHGNFFITVTAIGLVGFCYQINWYSKRINWLVKRMYFIYEFHWYWHILYSSLFSSFITNHPHLQFYVNWILVFSFGSLVSIIVTEIQIRVWNKFVDPPILKAANWIKLKVFKSNALILG